MSIYRSCRHCGRQVNGRVDKKFCDDYCRNQFNNVRRARSERNDYVKNINAALLRNRRILEKLLEDGSAASVVSRQQLQWLGYQFHYSTHTQPDARGRRVFYCYEYGCAPVRPGWFRVTRKNDE